MDSAIFLLKWKKNVSFMEREKRLYEKRTDYFNIFSSSLRHILSNLIYFIEFCRLVELSSISKFSERSKDLVLENWGYFRRRNRWKDTELVAIRMEFYSWNKDNLKCLQPFRAPASVGVHSRWNYCKFTSARRHFRFILRSGLLVEPNR